MTAIEGVGRSIEVADVVGLGDVDEALGDFYDRQVMIAASLTGVEERAIREWIEAELVTEQGFRGQSMEGPGPDPTVVPRVLENGHLLRAETRRGASWYEISHDRIVAPALARNERWRQANLNDLQVGAAKWVANGRSEALLLRGEVLAAAVEWANASDSALTALDEAFLGASVAAHEAAVVEVRRNRQVRAVALIALILAIAAVVAFVLAWSALRERDAISELIAAREAATAEALQALKDADSATALARAEARDAAADSALAKAELQDAHEVAADAAIQLEEAIETAEQARLAELDAALQAADAEAEAARARALTDTALLEQSQAQRQLEEAQIAAAEAAAEAAEAAAALANAEASVAALEQATADLRDEIAALLADEDIEIGPAVEVDCELEDGLRSVESAQASLVDFTNRSTEPVQVFWLDYGGERVLYADLMVDATYTQASFLTHPWVVTDQAGTCLAIVLPSELPTLHVVD